MDLQGREPRALAQKYRVPKKPRFASGKMPFWAKHKWPQIAFSRRVERNVAQKNFQSPRCLFTGETLGSDTQVRSPCRLLRFPQQMPMASYFSHAMSLGEPFPSFDLFKTTRTPSLLQPEQEKLYTHQTNISHH